MPWEQPKKWQKDQNKEKDLYIFHSVYVYGLITSLTPLSQKPSSSFGNSESTLFYGEWFHLSFNKEIYDIV